MYRSFISLGRYTPNYFILFVAMVNGIVSLISLSVLVGSFSWALPSLPQASKEYIAFPLSISKSCILPRPLIYTCQTPTFDLPISQCYDPLGYRSGLSTCSPRMDLPFLLEVNSIWYYMLCACWNCVIPSLPLPYSLLTFFFFLMDFGANFAS